MPGKGWNLNHVVKSNFGNLITDKNLPRSTNNRYQVSVLMSFEGGVPVDADFKISKFNVEVIGTMKERLAGNTLENRSILFIQSSVLPTPVGPKKRKEP